MKRLGSESECSTKERTEANKDDIDESESYDGPSSSSANIKGLGGKRIKLPEDVDSMEESETTTDYTDHEEAFTAVASLSRFKRIPIFVFDYHNEIWDFICKIFGKYMPQKNNTLLHFNAHPDMISYNTFYCRMDLTESSNWIMPLCFTGEINRIVWVKNSWSTQLPVGKYNLKIGNKGYRNYKVVVNCKMEYFISEGCYSDISEMKRTRDIELQVVNADTENAPNPKELLSGSDAINYILDIDVDFFSACNPFSDIYLDVDCYQRLSKICEFAIYPDENAQRLSNKRHDLLETLWGVFDYLDKHQSLVGICLDIKIAPELFTQIKELTDSLLRAYDSETIDWPMIFRAACSVGIHGYPDHDSTETELDLYYTRFEEFLRNLPHPPIIITIAISDSEGLCTRSSSIQEKVCEILVKVFGDKIHEKPIFCYMKEDNWNMKDL